MSTKISLIALLASVLVACKSTGPEKLTTIDGSNFNYDPKENSEFVFGEVASTLQKYAYSDICFELPKRSVANDCMNDQLAYENYVGKRGYYTEKEPLVDYSGYVIKEAILETGERIYIVKSNEYDHVGDNFIALEDYKKYSQFQPKPIVPGANVNVIGYSNISKGQLKVSSQDGHTFSEKEIKAIKKIASSYPERGTRIADLLTTLKVDYDDFEKRTIVTGLPYNNPDSFVTIRIIISDDIVINSFLVVHYEADNWLFVERFSIAADEFRWKSPALQFSRDHSAGTIWEWNTSRLDNENLSLVSKLANASNARVRFHGKKYYNDFELSKTQKEELAKLAEVVRLMNP
ncbi:hypothetical protein [Idiomarina ramblicola]|nr:hypothetical protein [Idiomarina ramblicola]